MVLIHSLRLRDLRLVRDHVFEFKSASICKSAQCILFLKVLAKQT